MKRVSQYDVVSRYLWLWVSGMMAGESAWMFAAEFYRPATLFAVFSLILLLLFLGVKPRPAIEVVNRDKSL